MSLLLEKRRKAAAFAAFLLTFGLGGTACVVDDDGEDVEQVETEDDEEDVETETEVEVEDEETP